jgi:hypothetical protein
MAEKSDVATKEMYDYCTVLGSATAVGRILSPYRLNTKSSTCTCMYLVYYLILVLGIWYVH